jgi:hypothetical protein
MNIAKKFNQFTYRKDKSERSFYGATCIISIEKHDLEQFFLKEKAHWSDCGPRR